MKLNFKTTGTVASLYNAEKPILINLSKVELFKLFAATEAAIDKVEASERDRDFESKTWVNFGYQEIEKSREWHGKSVGNKKPAPKERQDVQGTARCPGWEEIEGTDILTPIIPRFESCLAE